VSPNSATREANLLRALGSLVVNFSALEESLQDALFMAAGGQDPVISALTSGMSFRTLVRKFGVVCVTVKPPLGSAPDIQKFCNVLDAINDARNDLIHSAWTSNGPAGVPRRHKMSADAKKGVRLNPTDVPVSVIGDLIRKIEDADRKIWELVVSRTAA
jgi:hypothetical protein